MGSFAYTCGVSKLPILGGHKIRYILLTENPYDDTRPCSNHDLWFPRTFPIKAVYNDYGTVEEVEEGVGRDLWQEGLRLDLKAMGRGENPCHDVPTSKDMSWEDLLEAVVEQRVRVLREFSTLSTVEARQESMGIKTPEGVPTMQRVRTLLEGRPIVKKYCDEGYMLDRPIYGQVRIRWEGRGATYGKDAEKLAEIKPLFRAYAAVIAAGNGSVGSAQLLLYPKPNTKDVRRRWLCFHGSGHKKSKRGLRVDHLMIREDVWQGLLKMPVALDYAGKVRADAQAHRKAVADYYKECAGFRKLDEKLSLLMMPHSEKSIVGPWLARDSLPFTVSWGTHWRLLLEKKLPLSEVRSTLNAIGEMIHVSKVLMPARWFWEPSYSIGPQFGEWAEHARVNQLFTDIAVRKAKSDR